MRQRIVRVALIAALLALLVFGAPLAYVVNRLLLDGEQAELEHLALRAVVAMPEDFSSGQPADLPTADPSEQLGIYGDDGRRVLGTGPARGGRAVTEALSASLSNQGTDTQLVVAVPVSRDGRVTAVVRASSPRAAIAAQSFGAWGAMLGLGLLSAGAALALAVVQARRLARPIEALEETTGRLGAGDFGARADACGVAEIDRAADALNRTAFRLGDLVARERAFAANASHQLRTPLTGLRLTLETALSAPGADLAEAARAAIQTADELSRTVDDVLSFSRAAPAPTDPVELPALLRDAERRWSGLLREQGRSLRLRIEDPPPARAAEPAVRQILEVLLDNAYRHGRGDVLVTARDAIDAAAVDVQDEGTTGGRDLLPHDLPPGARHLGLALARHLAEAQDGRLVHATADPVTRLTLLLPPAPSDQTSG